MSERLLIETLASALRPLVAELVAEEVERQLTKREPDEPPPYLTVAQYARQHQTTPAAVRARIRRGALEAILPPGGREYLIPNGVATLSGSVNAPATLERPGARHRKGSSDAP